MKNTVTLHAADADPESLTCDHKGQFLLCRKGVSAAFPEALQAESLTIEARLKPSKKRGERKVVVLDCWNARVGRKRFDITSRRAYGLARVVGANPDKAFTFFVSLKK